MVMAGGWPGYKRLQLQAAGQEARPKPTQAKRGADCLGDSLKSHCSLVEEKQEGEEEGSAAEEARGVEGGAQGRSARVGRGQRREAVARRYNIQTTVSPQHPCEVGWKVATLVMPTSQTRPGHRGKHTRGGLARQGGPSPLSGFPSIPAEPGPPATQLLGHGR